MANTQLEEKARFALEKRIQRKRENPYSPNEPGIGLWQCIDFTIKKGKVV